MFKRKSAEKNPPVKSLMVKVEDFVNLEGDEKKPKDAVIGTRFDNGEKVIIQLTNSGEAADNRKRNTIDSFNKKSSQHHVETGGLMQFDTVWFNGDEINGIKSGIARWASFFEKNQAGIEANVSQSKVMLHVGATHRDGQDYRYGYVERLGKPMGVTRQGLEELLGKLLDKCNSEGAGARPTLRVIDDQGRVVEYAQGTQRDVKDANAPSGYRRQTLQEMMEDMKKSFGFKQVEKALEEGKGSLELIPSRSFKISPKTMNEGARGKAFMGLDRVFNSAEQSFALETWVRTVTSQETGAKFISNLGLVDHQRIEPLLLPSEAHPVVTYHPDLLASLQSEKGAERSAEQPEPSPAEMEQPDQNLGDHGPDDAPSYDDDVPGFN